MTELVVLVPVLRRPHRVAPLLASIRAATPNARTLFLADSGDTGEHVALRREGAEFAIFDGNYAKKINHGVSITDEPLIFFGADDLDFHPGWFEAAAARIRGRIAVIGTNDLCSPRVRAGRHATHSLLTREYAKRGTIDDPSVVLHEGYEHEFVDDEFVQTAIKRHAFDFAADAHVEHLHPDVGKAPMDALYAARPGRMRRGRKLYRERQRLWT